MSDERESTGPAARQLADARRQIEALETREVQRAAALEALQAAHDSLAAELADAEAALDKQAAARRQCEEALERSEARFHGLLDTTFDGIMVHDRGVVLEANESLARMFGYELGEVIGTDAVEWAVPEFQKIIRRNILEGYERPYQVAGRKKDGSIVHLELVGKAWEFAGREVRIVAFRDVTPRKRADERVAREQDRLRLLLEMYERDRELLAGEIHDAVVQPSVAARMLCDASRQTLQAVGDSRLPESCNECADLVRRGIDDARRLISGFWSEGLEQFGLVGAVEDLVLCHA